MDVEREVSQAVSHSCVVFAAVIAPAGVLMFGVLGEGLGIPPVDIDELIFVDAKSVRVTTYHTVCFDHVAVAARLCRATCSHIQQTR